MGKVIQFPAVRDQEKRQAERIAAKIEGGYFCVQDGITYDICNLNFLSDRLNEMFDLLWPEYQGEERRCMIEKIIRDDFQKGIDRVLSASRIGHDSPQNGNDEK